jgi:hypothetical protein
MVASSMSKETALGRPKVHGDAGHYDKDLHRWTTPRHYLYIAWLRMKAKDIDIDPRFKSYVFFKKMVLSNLGDKPKNHSLDRIDYDKGYFIKNLHWTTISEQVSKRRVTGNANKFDEVPKSIAHTLSRLDKEVRDIYKQNRRQYYQDYWAFESWHRQGFVSNEEEEDNG